jgi:hypothetical protein
VYVSVESEGAAHHVKVRFLTGGEETMFDFLWQPTKKRKAANNSRFFILKSN